MIANASLRKIPWKSGTATKSLGARPLLTSTLTPNPFLILSFSDGLCQDTIPFGYLELNEKYIESNSILF